MHICPRPHHDCYEETTIEMNHQAGIHPGGDWIAMTFPDQINSPLSSIPSVTAVNVIKGSLELFKRPLSS